MPSLLHLLLLRDLANLARLSLLTIERRILGLELPILFDEVVNDRVLILIGEPLQFHFVYVSEGLQFFLQVRCKVRFHLEHV